MPSATTRSCSIRMARDMSTSRTRSRAGLQPGPKSPILRVIAGVGGWMKCRLTRCDDAESDVGWRDLNSRPLDPRSADQPSWVHPERAGTRRARSPGPVVIGQAPRWAQVGPNCASRCEGSSCVAGRCPPASGAVHETHRDLSSLSSGLHRGHTALTASSATRAAWK